MAKMILTNGYYAAEKGSWNWLTNGSEKFSANKNIAFWFADLPNLTDGSIMFSGCSNLTSFSGDLSSLTNGGVMFRNCSNLTSWDTPLPALTKGSSMFSECTNLCSFSADLPNFTDGRYMFQYCDSLRSFTSDLSSLTSGDNMFGSSSYDCTKLDLASVQNIANTINDLTAAGTTGTIHIGMQKSLQSDDETAPINVALAAIRAKGWTVNEIYNKEY